jgi:hypothetical protein
MKYLQTMHDHQLDVDYRLYLVNARELSDRLFKGYGLDKLTLQTFNSKAKLGVALIELKKLELRGYSVEDNRRIRDVEEAKKAIEENRHVSPMTKIGVSFGYELMPIAVSCEGDIENFETKLELLDGFNRMFCLDEVPFMDILVKVYPKLNDAQWINSMLVYNSWKFANGAGAGRYMDRGFQLGLHYRYDIRFIDFVMIDSNIVSSIDLYTVGNDLSVYARHQSNTSGTFATLWNNDTFADDIRAIYEILTTRPVFRLKKRGKPEEIYDTSEKRYGYLARILEVFVSVLGEIRRYEFTQKVQQKKPFDRNILHEYLADESLQKHFVKVINMTVDGFVCNYIRDHMREEMKKRMYEGMGYPYQEPEKKTFVMPKIENINDIV